LLAVEKMAKPSSKYHLLNIQGFRRGKWCMGNDFCFDHI